MQLNAWTDWKRGTVCGYSSPNGDVIWLTEDNVWCKMCYNQGWHYPMGQPSQFGKRRNTFYPKVFEIQQRPLLNTRVALHCFRKKGVFLEGFLEGKDRAGVSAALWSLPQWLKNFKFEAGWGASRRNPGKNQCLGFVTLKTKCSWLSLNNKVKDKLLPFLFVCLSRFKIIMILGQSMVQWT